MYRQLALFLFATPLAAAPQFVRYVPMAIFDDGASETRLEVYMGDDVTSVNLQLLSGLPIVVAGFKSSEGTRQIPLRDDGLDGDRQAGDHVFTVGPIRWDTAGPACDYRCLTANGEWEGMYLVPLGALSVNSPRGLKQYVAGQYKLHVLLSAKYGRDDAITKYAPDLQVASHVINVVDNSGQVAARLTCNTTGAGTNDYVKRLYQYLPDTFDFLNITQAEYGVDCLSGGTHSIIKSAVTGLGLPLFDDTAAYGSAGRLLGSNTVLLDYFGNRGVFGPMMEHQWAAYLPEFLGFNSSGRFVLYSNAGTNWVDNHDGTFTPIADFQYGRLSLYLMGLIPAADVGPLYVALNHNQSFGYGSRIAGPFRTQTIADVQQAVGPRLPGPESTPRRYHIGYVVTSYGRLLTPPEMTLFNRQSQTLAGILPVSPVFGSRYGTFAEMTGGRQSMTTEVVEPPLPGSPLRFVPVTPCRIADTRGAPGPFGAPAIDRGQTRTLPLHSGNCGVPATAMAYSLNITVVPAATLSYLTVWPTGSDRPLVSTLNSYEGRVVANAAIVPAGNGGAINIFATDRTDVIVDINGYFTP